MRHAGHDECDELRANPASSSESSSELQRNRYRQQSSRHTPRAAQQAGSHGVGRRSSDDPLGARRRRPSLRRAARSSRRTSRAAPPCPPRHHASGGHLEWIPFYPAPAAAAAAAAAAASTRLVAHNVAVHPYTLAASLSLGTLQLNLKVYSQGTSVHTGTSVLAHRCVSSLADPCRAAAVAPFHSPPRVQRIIPTHPTPRVCTLAYLPTPSVRSAQAAWDNQGAPVARPCTSQVLFPSSHL